jgi:hypothetical protein
MPTVEVVVDSATVVVTVVELEVEVVGGVVGMVVPRPVVIHDPAAESSPHAAIVTRRTDRIKERRKGVRRDMSSGRYRRSDSAGSRVIPSAP